MPNHTAAFASQISAIASVFLPHFTSFSDFLDFNAELRLNEISVHLMYKMNGNRKTELHYIDTGFPYTVTDSCMDFYEGLTHVPVNYAHSGAMPDQGSAYWSMNMNPYKLVMSSSASTSYYVPFEVNDHLPIMENIEVSREDWEFSSTLACEEPTTTYSLPARESTPVMHAIPEECSPNHQESSSPEVVWQDNIDPDNMTYEELLDLGEAVGTQSRGLSPELIGLLPISKFKLGDLFKRKNSGKRCVVCQMTYRICEQQIKLPCGHLYHAECITKWLSFNKKCPVCNIEVFGDESKH